MKEKALLLHKNGKLVVESRVPLNNASDLSLAYTPGVAFPCLEIKEDKEKVYDYTSKGHMVGIVTDGTAVLGLGDIGPEAALPVMEGKALLLKKFANVDAFPICLDTKDPDQIIEIVSKIAPSFGGIILEDISSPRCVKIERELKKKLPIPVFHDDQHGTAIVVGAALINACRYLKKSIFDLRVVISGTGAAGSAVMRIIKGLGVKEINAYKRSGVVNQAYYHQYDFVLQELLDENIVQSPPLDKKTLADILVGADVFIGVSAPNIVTKEMIETMNTNAIVFALSNPTPEIMPEEAKLGKAAIIGTGRSDFPNQINNVLAFPGIFKGALLARASQITETMKLKASYAIAYLITEEELNPDYIIPSVFDTRVVDVVSKAMIEEVKKQKEE